MLLTIYDPDIAVLAERRLHDGNAKEWITASGLTTFLHVKDR